MSNTATAPGKTGTQKDVQTIVNDKIIEQLNKGIVPWRKPWTNAGIPRNIISRKPYRNINLLLLSSLGYERNFFITEKQLGEIGGSIKANEKPHVAVYWNYTDQSGNKQAPVLRYYQVYNMAQCVWPMEAIQPEVPMETHTIAVCQEIVNNMPHRPDIKSKDPQAYYDAIEDYINLPKLKLFASEELLYREYFHQLMHSTGHHTRLDRMGLVQMAEYGYTGCSQEELVADIGTCYFQSLTGIAKEVDSNPAYIQSCIEKLRKDRTFIFTAASQAQKGIDFILNAEPEAETVEQAEE
jgi:antirestriction protein ArdC